MLYFEVDKSDTTSYIYKQIYEKIKEQIMSQKLRTEEKLPSKRELAKLLDVSINSVALAYEQLLAEGYIYSEERKGYFVENITQLSSEAQNHPFHNFPEELIEKETHRDGWLSLSHIDVNISKFPFKEWVKCQNQALKTFKHELGGIPHPQGPYIVREEIARLIGLTRNVVCRPEQIIIGPGTQNLIRQIMNLEDQQTKTAVENPGYFRFHQLLKNMNFPVSMIPLDRHGISIEKVKELNPDYLFITPSHQFPTGTIMPISRRIELLNWASAADDRYIVEDDYDSEFKYGTDSIPSLHSLDRNQRVIYSGTFSKTLFPSLRISYIVVPIELLKKYKKQNANWIQGSNLLNLYTLYFFLKSGEYARHIKRMNHYYETKRKKLIEELKHQFQDKMAIQDIPAGLHFLAYFKTERTYEDVTSRANQLKLEIYTIHRFLLEGLSEQEQGSICLVIGFASLRDQDIKESVSRLAECVG
ncbi:GntR family transcriptional regulator [Alkalihalophilus pseudofirmus]|nr:GntR family transcriptional regulator [Alkalihalophilus pseudofirmus]